jgi:hypothetical protein
MRIASFIMTESPIVCTLGPDALKARKVGLLARVARLSTSTARIEAGYRFEFTADTETLSLIADMIDAERRCCRFLRFDLRVERDGGPVSLEITGPPGTQEFVDALLA